MSQIEISELPFQLIVESVPNAIVIINKEGKIVYVNSLTEKLFEYKRTELLGQPVEILIPARFKGKHPHFRSMFLKSPTTRAMGSGRELFAAKKNNQEIPVEIGLNPLTTEEGTMVLASIIDITERKKIEAVVQEQMVLLESKNKELQQFNYIASHDLQEPLRTVLNYIQILEEDYSDKLDKQIFEFLYTIRDASLRMQMLVRSLLDFSRLGKNRIIEQIDFNVLLKTILSDLNSLIEDSNAKITLKKLPVLNVCEVEFRQLFQNLINNAIKFRKKEISPKIEVGCVENKDFTEFYISDNGIGIDPKNFERIFWIFQRLHPAKLYKGYGIGLANCKKIVELHGGRIWVESIREEGSTFKFIIKK